MTTGMQAHVFVLPGFSRQAVDVELFVRESRAEGWDARGITLAPRLFPPLYMATGHLRRVATRIAAEADGSPVAIVGHSAGAAAGCFLVGCLMESGVNVRGIVMADGVDSPNHLIARTLPSLITRRVSAVLAPASPCNRQGAPARYLVDFPWVRTTLVPGAGHGNFEGADVAIYRRVCRDASTPAVAEEFRRRVLAELRWVVGDGRSAP